MSSESDVYKRQENVFRLAIYFYKKINCRCLFTHLMDDLNQFTTQFFGFLHGMSF